MVEDKDYIVIVNGSIVIDVNASDTMYAVKGALAYIKNYHEGLIISSIKVC